MLCTASREPERNGPDDVIKSHQPLVRFRWFEPAPAAALVQDLKERGMLEDTLVVWAGEFGRTPRINRQAGRDHWGFCQSAILAGAGIRGGQVYGSSDAHAAYAAELPVSPDDLAATVFNVLGIPLDQEMQDAQSRPLPLCTGRPVSGLF